MHRCGRRIGTAAVGLALVVTVLTTGPRPGAALDPAFGGTSPGTTRLLTPVLLDPRTVVIAPDGGIVMANAQWDGASYFNRPIVQRLTPAGIVDPSFGDPSTPGSVALDTQFNPEGVGIDATGRIVVAAWNAATGLGPPPVVARLSADGVRDPGFAGSLDTGDRRPSRLLQVTGGVVLSTWDPLVHEACLHRLRDSDGAVDGTFGAAATPGRQCVTGLVDAFDTFGVPVTGGYVLVVSTVRALRVVRTDLAGTVVSDRSISWATDTFVTDLRPDGDGDGFVMSAGDGTGRSLLIRLDSALAYDTSLDPTGPTPGRLDLGSFAVESLLVLPDGRLLVTGADDRIGEALLFTVDGRADGALEPASARPGTLVMPFDPQGHPITRQHFAAATMQGDRVVVIGGEHDGSFGGLRNYADLVVVRSDPIGAPVPKAAGVIRPLPPARILDTRPGAGQTGYTGAKPGAGETVTLAVAGRGGVPRTGAGAVVLNLTATEASAAGYVTVWPSGSVRPTASNLNLERPGQTLPNLVVAPLGADGSVAIYTQSGTHLLADVLGWFPAGGGLQALVPTRILETRADQGQVGYRGQKPVDGQTIALAVAGRAGLPATGVEAVVMNVTITDADGPGYVSVWPSGVDRPLLSNLNVDRTGQTMQNLVIVPVGPDGSVQLFTLRGGHLLADLVGWLPSGSGFVPAEPGHNRVLDTRGPSGTDPRPTAGSVVQVTTPWANRILAVNVAATESAGPGYVTVWTGATEPPLASNLNLDAAGQTIANLALVATDDRGQFSIYTQSGTHLVADVFGAFALPPA